MSNEQESFELLEEAVNKLISSKFILSGQNITDILKCLIYREDLRKFITECCKGVSYREEFERAKTTGDNKEAFTLPKSNRIIVALVTGMLSDFDKGTLKLSDFMREFFADENSNVSYRKFCDGVIAPYLNAFRQLFVFGREALDIEADPERDSLFTGINPAAIGQIESIVRSINTVFVSDNSLSDTERKEYTELTDGLCFALSTHNARFAKVTFIGIKYALRSYRKVAKYLVALENTLSMYAVI